jgi:hypothetical protein
MPHKQQSSPTNPMDEVKQRMERFITKSKEVNLRLAQKVAALEMQLKSRE